MNEEDESSPVVSMPLGPARVLGVGMPLAAPPAVVVILVWPEHPGVDLHKADAGRGAQDR
jgi:hypothetical protein